MESALNKTIKINGDSYLIVGVLSETDEMCIRDSFLTLFVPPLFFIYSVFNNFHSLIQQNSANHYCFASQNSAAGNTGKKFCYSSAAAVSVYILDVYKRQP